METDPEQEREALRLKTIAETKFTNSNLKSALKHAKKAHRLCPKLDGLSSVLTAFKILRVASKAHSGITDWYKILQVEPFSHINTIKKQYKHLALVLHPDKNPFLGCEEAFKLVGEGFRVLSDKIRRKEYDMKLRIRLQEERVNENSVVETFWTACSRCRLLHQFERRYLGHNLVCPACKKSFEAVEVEGGDKEDDGVRVRVRSERLRRKVVDLGSRVKMGSLNLGTKGTDSEGIGDLGSRRKIGRVDLKGKVSGVDLKGKIGSGEKMGSVGLRRKVRANEIGSESVRSANLQGIAGEWGGGKLRTGGLRRKISSVDEVLERSRTKRVKFGEEMMTLAEMQLEAKQKAMEKKAQLKKQQQQQNQGAREKEKKTHVILRKSSDLEIEKNGDSKKSPDMGTKAKGTSSKSRNMEIGRSSGSGKSVSLEIERHMGSRKGDLEIMAVEDSDFYDFDKDRMERSFKKGQLWAIYDDDDGMPRHYGLIDEVVSVNPFEVKLSWLDLQSNGNEGLICWEKMGFHVSCGRFKVARKATVNSVNIFSHVVECERAAREAYRIYPKKGSVWALYNEAALDAGGRNLSARDKRCYDIVVFLTTYSEMHGLSMAYLDKVDGFKTIFKRREVGCHAIQWLEKDDVRLFSHQIPARKFSGDEVPDLLKDCWELDPASLPSDMLTIDWGR